MELSNRSTDSAELIRSIKKGEKELLKAFYLAEAEPFKAWISSKFGMKQSSELTDIYQECILILNENIRRGLLDNLESSVKTYLYGIAKHLVLKKYNRELKEGGQVEELKEHVVFLSQDDQTDEQIKLREHASRLVREMEEPCRSILMAFYYDQLSSKEIAHRMNYKNETVVRNQKKRCMDRLKNALMPYYQETTML